LIIVENDDELGKKAAGIVADQIRRKPDSVLGLPTGSTPISMYKELVRLHVEEGLDFSRVTTFNLDEYYPMPKSRPQSYNYYMDFWFFRHVNIPEKNRHVPDGEIPESQLTRYCKQYENEIVAAGGIDLQVLGIGASYYEGGKIRGGHIGFNEAGSSIDSRTRKVELTEKTREDNSRFFGSLDEVPKYSISMGIGTILEAKKVLLLASGEHKAEVMKIVIEGEITSDVPASYLKKHPDLTIMIDRHAASKLSRMIRPWIYTDRIDWSNKNLIMAAVIWLASETGKPITGLTRDDFIAHHLEDLVNNYQSLKELNDLCVSMMRAKLMDENSCPKNQRIFIISPHPDDDVICLGATMNLLNQFNELRVCYMVSGVNAVKNSDIMNFYKSDSRLTSLLKKLNEKPDALSEQEMAQVMMLKKRMREIEATNAVKIIGIAPENLIFLDCPFYNERIFIDGKIRKSIISSRDISLLHDELLSFKPDIIIVNKEREDPHGTHGKVLQIFELATKNLDFTFDSWYYRGAWNDYSLHEIDLIYCFDKEIMDLKLKAIKEHVSQLDPLFPGDDLRPFWKRAEDRNRQLGEELLKLGLIQEFCHAESFKVKRRL